MYDIIKYIQIEGKKCKHIKKPTEVMMYVC